MFKFGHWVGVDDLILLNYVFIIIKRFDVILYASKHEMVLSLLYARIFLWPKLLFTQLSIQSFITEPSKGVNFLRHETLLAKI